MPLEHSKSPGAFKRNVRTLMHEVGESPHVKSRAQALAIAYAEKRRARAEGGAVHEGPIVSTVPGRTDDHPIDVGSGAYVIPAEAVSHLGQSNSLAGLEKLRRMGAEGLKRLVLASNPPRKGKSTGGAASRHDDANVGKPVPINAAGGEFVVPPSWVHHIGNGDMKHAHVMLDHWVMSNRKKHLNTLRGLKPPARD